MKEVAVESWEEFEENLRYLREERRKCKDSGGPRPTDFLFRGQENSCWNLSTTLERAGRNRMEYRDYYHLIFGIHQGIESLGFGRWDLRIPSDFEKALDEISISFGKTPNQEEYGYMVHLRHHGFPSPLLDWTRSEYIAAFFAFNHPKSDRVAIYVYQASPEGDYSGGTGVNIHVCGPRVRTHPRHVLQQAVYTICFDYKIPDESTQEFVFVPHEEAFALNRSVQHEQDALWKFVLPATERKNVLQILDAHNLNAFSLFGTQESLMDTLAVREVDLKEE